MGGRGDEGRSASPPALLTVPHAAVDVLLREGVERLETALEDGRLGEVELDVLGVVSAEVAVEEEESGTAGEEGRGGGGGRRGRGREGERDGEDGNARVAGDGALSECWWAAEDRTGEGRARTPRFVPLVLARGAWEGAAGSVPVGGDLRARSSV